MSEYDYFYNGSFCVYYGQDNKRNAILITERGKVFKDKSEGLGTAGGYVDAANHEQPAEAAVRELTEEILRPDGSPVLKSVTPDHLSLVASQIDYDAGKPGTRYAGNVWHGHKCELTSAEISALKSHIARMEGDPDYAAASREACRQETQNVFLMTPDEIIRGIENGSMKFAYPHEAKVVLAVAKPLCAPGSSPAPECEI
jgi:hypothetical protein